MRGFISTDAEKPFLLEWLAAISVLIVMVRGLFVGAKHEKTLGRIVLRVKSFPKKTAPTRQTKRGLRTTMASGKIGEGGIELGGLNPSQIEEWRAYVPVKTKCSLDDYHNSLRN